MDAWSPTIATLIINGAVAIFVYGRLTERVAAQKENLEEHKRLHGKVDERLDDHEKRIRLVEFGDSLQALAQALHQVHGEK